MATTLGFVFTDANLSSSILKKILNESIKNTFNAISCDGDTSTNDMVSLISTNKANNPKINNFKDSKLKNFRQSLNDVLLNLAKRVASDGEGASKFITINCKNSKTDQDAKNICFAIANSPLVKTAIAGEDANWGRVVMAIGKTKEKILQDKITIKFGNLLLATKGERNSKVNLSKIDNYMKKNLIEIVINLNLGNESSVVYGNDLNKEYITITADSRS